MEVYQTKFGESGLAARLKQAREDKGLSQRALSAKVNVPQGHISNIESGRVDIKASSLIELARALDLELVLIPRGLVPAVESLSGASRTHETSDDITRPQLDEDNTVHRAHRLLDNLQQDALRITRTSGEIPEITRLLEAGRALDRMRLPPAFAEQVLKAVESINLRSGALKEALSTQGTMRDLLRSAEVADALEEASRTADKLRRIRNTLAHGASEAPKRTPAAYRLGNGDDDE